MALSNGRPISQCEICAGTGARFGRQRAMNLRTMKVLTHRNLVGPAIGRLRRKRGWSQTDFALHLQLVGWNISRSGIAKLEAQLLEVGDCELCYLRQVLRVDVRELFPPLNPHKTIREGMAELLSKKHADELAVT